MITETRGEQGTADGLAVYPASDFRVTGGANLGDGLAECAELVPDDIYGLACGAALQRLSLAIEPGLKRITVADGSACGQAGAEVHIDCCATFMAPDGTTVDALLLVELERGSAMIADLWMLPFAPLADKTDYALVAVDPQCGPARFAELTAVSFARGTHITLATGEQRPIEALTVGDRVLTRNHGVQPIRWIGQRTLRAAGAFAPIVIAEGALNNARDLMLSPNQRVFIYQRKDVVGAGRAEVMVRADMLVNGTSVTRGDGGFVEYFELLFDAHEIVYAEGIATESLPPDTPATATILPRAVNERIGSGRNRRRAPPHAVTLSDGALDSATAAELLRRASTR